MDTVVWIAQILIALAFAIAGVSKLIQSREKLVARMEWADEFSMGQLRLIGLVEALGAIGVVLPALTGILPWLTPLAGIGLGLTMAGAVLLHVRRGEFSHIGINVVLLIMAAFVAYGRFVIAPIA